MRTAMRDARRVPIDTLPRVGQNRVVILNRRGELSRAKIGNLNQIRQAIDPGALKCEHSAEPVRIEAGSTLCYHGLGSRRAVMPLEGVQTVHRSHLSLVLRELVMSRRSEPRSPHAPSV